MLELDQKLWFGIGNQPAGTNGGLIASVETNGTLTAEYAVDEQGVHDMHLHDGKIYIPGTDPTDDWTFGNLYIRDTNGTWSKRRTLPNVLHTWGLCHDADDNLWVATGAHTGDNATWQGAVFRSSDDGLTWDQSAIVNNYRVYDIDYHAGAFWAIGYTASYNQILYTSADGLTWNVVSGITPERLQRFISHGDSLICQQATRDGIIVIDNLGQIDTKSCSFDFGYPSLNCMVSDGVRFYCVDENGHIWMTDDFAAWSRYSYLNNAISIGYWPSENCLIASDIGPSAKLWKISL